MLRIMTTLAVIAALAIPAAPAHSSNPILVNRTVIQGDTVRLGDLFRNVGDKAGVTVEPAPAPGQSVTIYSGQLTNIARAHGLDWKPNSQYDRVAVERASKMVPRDTVDQALIRAMAEQGVASDVEIEIGNWQFRLFVPVEKPMTVAVENLIFDSQSKRFSGVISAPMDDPTAERVQISGRIHPVVEVPVLRRRVNPGELIRRDDIEFMKVRDVNAQRGVVSSPGALIGLTPRRILAERTAIRENDIQPLVLVQRNEMVTLTLSTKAMSLSTQGKALDNGAKGDTVRVLNVKSNKTVEGIVTGPNTIAVKAPTKAALN